jgi:hypothetical protein
MAYMKHQRQGYNECLLASLAMIIERPLSEIQRIVYQDVSVAVTGRPCPWARITATGTTADQKSERFWAAFKLLCQRLGVSAKRYQALKGKSDPRRSDGEAYAYATRRPHLGGKGIIIAHLSFGCHAVAFNNGWIHDPGEENVGAQRFGAWVKRVSAFQWRVIRW